MGGFSEEGEVGTGDSVLPFGLFFPDFGLDPNFFRGLFDHAFIDVLEGSGKKFELPKKSNFFPLELFSSNFFLVHMEAEVLQQWQTTHFKACSK